MNELKICFLDFDGVLSSLRTVAAYNRVRTINHIKTEVVAGTIPNIKTDFDPIAVNLIRNVLDITGAKIVISSSWRLDIPLNEIRKLFHNEFGWPDGSGEYIIGRTPARNLSHHRGQEIEDWIDENVVLGTDASPFKYCIIDDGYNFYHHQIPFLIQTDPYNGFLYENYCKMLEMFDIITEDEML